MMSPILRRSLQLLALVALQAILLFVSAGTIRWLDAWWYLGLYVGMLFLASFVLIPHRPDVIAERGKGSQGGKPWDLWITRLISIPSLGLLILAGLDERFGWTPPLPLWAFVLGVALFIIGYAAVLWAMYSNQYFSQVVRIQTERGHTAVSEGPYRIIRHPGYAGMLTTFLGCVLILDTLDGLFLYLLYAVLVIIRTSLEDRTLQAELPGYTEYAKQTKYRLLPGVW
jgi:protein-S-isoprenylcysteine O-methyltransferase Ste14